MTELDNVGASWEGWSTRATWLANLWLANDQIPYLEACRIADHSENAEHCGIELVAMLTSWMNASGDDSSIVQDFTETIPVGDHPDFDPDLDEEIDDDDGEPIMIDRSIVGDINVEELGQHWLDDAAANAAFECKS
jgi:hypothetical protein